jgi:hypothetical protein
MQDEGEVSLMPLNALLQRKCKQCKTIFRANRADAEFCSTACRQAAYRQSNSLKQNLQLAKNMHDADNAAQEYEAYRALAVTLFRRAARRGIEDVRFVATPSGIVVVGEYVRWAIYTPSVPDFLDGTDDDLWGLLRATEYDAGDPKIIEALSQRASFAGSSIIRKQHETEDADAIQSPAQYVMLLAFHWEKYFGRRVYSSSREWLMTNYAEGESYLQGTTHREMNHGGPDIEDNQSIAKGLTTDQLFDDEIDRAQHRDVGEDEADEDEGGRGYEVFDPNP